MVLRGNPGWEGPRGLLGEGQHPSSLLGETPSHLYPSCLPSASDKVPTLQPGAQSPADSCLPAPLVWSAPPPPHPPLQLPRMPGLTQSGAEQLWPGVPCTAWAWNQQPFLSLPGQLRHLLPGSALPHLLRNPDSESTSQNVWCPRPLAQASALILSNYSWAGCPRSSLNPGSRFALALNGLQPASA